MKVLESFIKSVDYIEKSLIGNISFKHASSIAGVNSYNYQKIFSYITGYPLSDYIRLRRLSKAAFDIQTSDDKIIDIGFKYGYDFSSSFNRAFKSFHGVSPHEAKRFGVGLKTLMPFSLYYIGENILSYKVDVMKSFSVIGIREEISFDMEDNFKKIRKFWTESIKSKTLEDVIKTAKNKNDRNIFGISAYENNKVYYYIASKKYSDKKCLEVKNSDARKEFFEYDIPSSLSVSFECKNALDIQNVYRSFFSKWLLDSGYKYAKFPDLEIYFDNGKPNMCFFVENPNIL